MAAIPLSGAVSFGPQESALFGIPYRHTVLQGRRHGHRVGPNTLSARRPGNATRVTATVTSVAVAKS
jgi:hypothetical protein